MWTLFPLIWMPQLPEQADLWKRLMLVPPDPILMLTCDSILRCRPPVACQRKQWLLPRIPLLWREWVTQSVDFSKTHPISDQRDLRDSSVFIHKCKNRRLLTLSETILDEKNGTSLLAPWMRICLLKQGTQVHSPVRKDSACCEAAKPVCQLN